MSELSTKSDGALGITGTVLCAQANFYQVRLDSTQFSDFPNSLGEKIPNLTKTHLGNGESVPQRDLLCTRRARLKKIGITVMVGDRVQIEEPDWPGGRGAIARVFPRTSELKRPPVANANQVLLIFALAQPNLDPLQLTRFLVTIEQTSMPIVVGLSKTDLVSVETVQAWCDRLERWGYTALPMSLIEGTGLDKVQERLKSKLTVLCGPSGVGKSSLINRLMPHENVRVGAVSEKYHQGRHTTRHVELFSLPGGGLLADTPGFNQPNILASSEELERYFPEIRSQLSIESCQFKNCLHRNEPNCGVRGSWERYEHYLMLLEELSSKVEDSAYPKDKKEERTKVKHRTSGTVDHEPRLEQKKYRRQSRRSQRQSLEELCSEEFLEDSSV